MASDMNVSDVLIALSDSSGMVVGATMTDSEGDYLFSDLPAGVFSPTEAKLANYMDVSDIQGEKDSMIVVTLGVGDSSTGNGFVD